MKDDKQIVSESYNEGKQIRRKKFKWLIDAVDTCEDVDPAPACFTWNVSLCGLLCGYHRRASSARTTKSIASRIIPTISLLVRAIRRGHILVPTILRLLEGILLDLKRGLRPEGALAGSKHLFSQQLWFRSGVQVAETVTHETTMNKKIEITQ